ncbi:MAG: 8-oxoguanine DNA glycosylase [Deltaproteobacteria bacterium]|nr:8-oxoguanine DNA glycosylase [Deltaproteobacteria bacterium]
MKQSTVVYRPQMAPVHIDLPSPEEEVKVGVPWGSVDAFPSPAYWAYQVLARRALGEMLIYKLGRNLQEEVGACLLGGHGIPAGVGLAAYEYLRSLGAFEGPAPTEESFYTWLSKPIPINGRAVRYRFAKQKAKYLAGSLRALQSQEFPTESGRALRDWLVSLPGIGLKTASWIVRNWLDADDVAILDIHILRAGALGGFFTPGLTVEKDYLLLEQQFLEFSEALGVRPAELDAVIWYEMMASPKTVHGLIQRTQEGLISATGLRPPAKKGQSNTYKLSLCS